MKYITYCDTNAWYVDIGMRSRHRHRKTIKKWNTNTVYSSTSTIWRRCGLKRIPRFDLDYLIHRVFLST